MFFSSQQIKDRALALGFAACGIARAEPVAGEEADRLDRWLAGGCHAGMRYMENHRAIRLDPAGLVEGARSVISVALNYYPAERREPSRPYIAYYAYGKDYHDVVKRRLRQLWQAILDDCRAAVGEEEPPAARVFTDSAPILERYWAWKAGLGWIGKNTCLILPGKGSFFFLGEIVTTLEVDRYDTPLPDRCGSCERCLKACPTGALDAPRHLDASRCLSYLTIEHRGEIPAGQAERLGNRLYGCDTCQKACPWNRFATPTEVEEFRPSAELLALDWDTLRAWDEETYRRVFAHSAVKRAKYEGLTHTIRAIRRENEPPSL